MPEGIIMKGIGGFYYVKSNNEIYECKARGVLRKGDATPLPGDWVNFEAIDENRKKGSIEQIIPRSSLLVRPAVANVDQIALVVSVISPEPDLVLLDKLLITAEKKGINAFICFNKVDLDAEGSYKNTVDAYRNAGYTAVEISSLKNIGFDRLKGLLNGRITVFAGQSGVGKSTILNRIMDSMIMQTGSVSKRIERGRHTTRHAELVELQDGGYVLDTPGFSSYELTDISASELENYYPEFVKYLGSCRFNSCSHLKEPECSIKEALDKGLIDSGRYSRYGLFYDSLKSIKEYKNKKS